ncbi:permease-like cell division protein FtsX [Anaerosporobacter faecicola]|uniref:permease-like cell division protein FtsX n=1 Tax=Anaerosporobacter faecicola TaxID=2718714 RepID=UPI00143AB23A|nr:permease-like cell division protein FtsX [Anaerosporobacter faecicola]
MKFSSIVYSIKQGFKNIHRNRMFSLASIGTIATCLFLFGIFYFILANFRYTVKIEEKSVGISIFFDDGATQEQIDAIGEQIKARPEVATMEYISAEQAWEKYKQDTFANEQELVDTFQDDNPLADSASYVVYLDNVSQQPEFVEYVQHIDGVRKVNNSDKLAKGLSDFNILLGYGSAAIIILLLAVAIFLISTTITMGISVRKEEISIMKLIGATDYFVRSPFIVEGIIIGLIGAMIPLFILYLIYNQAITYIGQKFSILSNILHFLNINHVFGTLIPISLAMGVGIGLIGSIITVRKHLRV